MVDKRTEDGQPPEGQDRQFTLPENPYAHLPGLEEAARKFQHAGVVNDAPSLHLASKWDEKVITEDDLLPVEAAIAKTCQAAGVPKAQIDEIIDELRSHIGASKSGLETIIEDAKKVAHRVAHEAAIAKSETPEQKIEKLWGEIKALDKKIDEAFDEFEKYLTPEERDERKKLRKAVEAAETEEQRRATQKALQQYDKDHLDRIRERAVKAGDTETVTKVEEAIKTNEEKEKKLAKREELIQKIQANSFERTDDHANISSLNKLETEKLEIQKNIKDEDLITLKLRLAMQEKLIKPVATEDTAPQKSGNDAFAVVEADEPANNLPPQLGKNQGPPTRT